MSSKINSSYKILLPLAILLTAGAIPMIYIGAKPNYETLIEFGKRLYGDDLAWTLPAATIGYEILATVTYFMIPKHLVAIRQAALRGAIAGFLLTVVLAMAWVIIHGGPDVAMKVTMKVIPSGVVAGYMHLVMMVWDAVEAAKETQLTTQQTSTQTTLTNVLPAVSPAQVPAKPIASTPPRPAARRKPAPAPAPVAVLPDPPLPDPRETDPRETEEARQEEVVATFVEELAALPETPPATPEPVVAEPVAEPFAEIKLPAWLSAKPEHIALAKEFIVEAIAEGKDPKDVKSGKIRKDFGGIKDRQVSNALRIARIHLGLEAPPLA